jgi:formate C-acetyltransferase
VQINVISSDTLRAAQKEPEKYRDLMVKVAGYNAFFTQLSKQLQDSIIARTEHGV